MSGHPVPIQDLAIRSGQLMIDAATIYRDAAPEVQSELEQAIDAAHQAKSWFYRALRAEERTQKAGAA